MDAHPLTIAYVAMGAASAIRERGHHAVATVWAGPEMTLIAEVVGWAGHIDALATDADLVGSLAYEVAEPFGEELTRALLTYEHAEPAALAPGIARRLVREASTAAANHDLED